MFCFNLFFLLLFFIYFFAPGKVRTWGDQKVTKQISSTKSVSISNFTGSSKALSYTLTVTRQPLLAALSEETKTASRARLKALSSIQALCYRRALMYLRLRLATDSNPGLAERSWEWCRLISGCSQHGTKSERNSESAPNNGNTARQFPGQLLAN